MKPRIFVRFAINSEGKEHPFSIAQMDTAFGHEYVPVEEYNTLIEENEKLKQKLSEALSHHPVEEMLKVDDLVYYQAIYKDRHIQRPLMSNGLFTSKEDFSQYVASVNQEVEWFRLVPVRVSGHG